MDNTIIFFSQKDLSKRWSISHITLEKWRVYGKGPRFCKISNRVRYHINDIVAYEDKQFRNHTSESPSVNGGSI